MATAGAARWLKKPFPGRCEQGTADREQARTKTRLKIFYLKGRCYLKKIFVLLFVLVGASLAYGLAQAATMRTNGAVLKAQPFPALTQKATTTATHTATPARCVIVTGLQQGRVNLRTCAGLACAVSSVLTEGQTLTVLQPGRWVQVQTGAGLTGYLNSKFCK